MVKQMMLPGIAKVIASHRRGGSRTALHGRVSTTPCAAIVSALPDYDGSSTIVAAATDQ